jgi:hypothetical protein
LRSRPLQLALLAATFVVALVLLLGPVQRRLWTVASGVPDVIVSGLMILPFVLLPLFVRPLHRLTRWAWILAAVMSLDILFFILTTFAPTGGHPSFEALASFYLGLMKPFLVLIAVSLLGVGFIRGERALTVVLGFICLLGEALYGFYPPEIFGALFS